MSYRFETSEVPAVYDDRFLSTICVPHPSPPTLLNLGSTNRARNRHIPFCDTVTINFVTRWPPIQVLETTQAEDWVTCLRAAVIPFGFD